MSSTMEHLHDLSSGPRHLAKAIGCSTEMFAAEAAMWRNLLLSGFEPQKFGLEFHLGMFQHPNPKAGAIILRFLFPSLQSDPSLLLCDPRSLHDFRKKVRAQIVELEDRKVIPPMKAVVSALANCQGDKFVSLLLHLSSYKLREYFQQLFPKAISNFPRPPHLITPKNAKSEMLENVIKGRIFMKMKEFTAMIAQFEKKKQLWKILASSIVSEQRKLFIQEASLQKELEEITTHDDKTRCMMIHNSEIIDSNLLEKVSNMCQVWSSLIYNCQLCSRMTHGPLKEFITSTGQRMKIDGKKLMQEALLHKPENILNFIAENNAAWDGITDANKNNNKNDNNSNSSNNNDKNDVDNKHPTLDISKSLQAYYSSLKTLFSNFPSTTGEIQQILGERSDSQSELGKKEKINVLKAKFEELKIQRDSSKKLVEEIKESILKTKSSIVSLEKHVQNSKALFYSVDKMHVRSHSQDDWYGNERGSDNSNSNSSSNVMMMKRKDIDGKGFSNNLKSDFVFKTRLIPPTPVPKFSTFSTSESKTETKVSSDKEGKKMETKSHNTNNKNDSKSSGSLFSIDESPKTLYGRRRERAKTTMGTSNKGLGKEDIEEMVKTESKNAKDEKEREGKSKDCVEKKENEAEYGAQADQENFQKMQESFQIILSVISYSRDDEDRKLLLENKREEIKSLVKKKLNRKMSYTEHPRPLLPPSSSPLPSPPPPPPLPPLHSDQLDLHQNDGDSHFHHPHFHLHPHHESSPPLMIEKDFENKDLSFDFLEPFSLADDEMISLPPDL